jgi:hypothetical protein
MLLLVLATVGLAAAVVAGRAVVGSRFTTEMRAHIASLERHH